MEQAKKMDSMKVNSNGVMFGLPVLIKDNIDVSGLLTTAGSLALSDNIAKKDARIVANLRRNGALILGKTNMTEFANYTGDNMPGGYSSRGGQVKNAYDRAKNPSGSSSGSAVAMSAGFCSAAIGTDASFSIVGCVTENGVTGLKPAHGSLSSDGINPIAITLDSAGPITRDLSDSLLVYSCMRDEALQPIEPIVPEKMKLAINIFNRDQVSEIQLARYDTELNELNELKADHVQITEVTHVHTEYQCDIMRFEFRHDLEKYLSKSRASLKTLKEIVSYYESNPDQMMKYGDYYLRGALECDSGDLDNIVYIKAMTERKRLRKEVIKSISKYDACLMTGPTNVMHFIGLPSLALRLCMAGDGTPRGIILYGADERRLLAAALTIERYCAPITMPKL
ncbi:amidase family protein [Clostridium boliviensis]|uniref:Amidase family protein n=1 Tax=Clostridium boliviensis TaxID=318465 RepID=A0ABU4GTF7_9CLOT|nr:amidase family protein [Clostridium boliviensis]MDW2800911.1 amidase family protein [Clostridium boliviensis]